MPIPRLAAATLAALLLAGVTATARQPAYVTRDLAATGATVFTTVRDTTTGDDVVLGRDPEGGSVTNAFGGGFPSVAIAATPLRTVYVLGADAAVRVYRRSTAGFQLTDTWPVVSPVAGQVLAPTAVAPVGDGVLVAFGAPGGFRGVVALDGAGRAVATWSAPDETLPAGVTPSPEALTVTPRGQALVHVAACRGADCTGAAPEGYVYELLLATPAGAPATLTTTGRWQGPSLASLSDLAAVLPTELLATSAADAADVSLGELVLTPGGGAILGQAARTVSDPALRVSVTGPPGAAAAFVLAGSGGAGDPYVVQSFVQAGSDWLPSQDQPWTASWGPAGPPEPLRCGGHPATIVGTAGDDVLRGSPRGDVIVARGGDDVVRGGGGADFVCLGPGDDTANGGPGADLVMGGRGSDRLSGGAGPDLIGGGPGRDRAVGGGGRDRCRAEVVRGCEL